MKERKDGAQSFSGSLPIQLVKKDGANVALKIAEADIKMDGQESLAKNANMNLAKAHINQKAYNTLQSAIDPAKLKMALPKEFQKLNMAVVSTRFRSYGGHAIAEINLSAENPAYTQ
jgi:predicted aspartyl protease